MATSSRIRVFLSYRRQDTRQTARELFDVLRARLSADVFMDVDSIVPGESFPEALESALASSHVVLALIGAAVWYFMNDSQAVPATSPADSVRTSQNTVIDAPTTGSLEATSHG